MKKRKISLVGGFLVVVFLILNISNANANANDNSGKIILPKDGIFNFRNYSKNSKFYSHHFGLNSKYSPYLEYYMINYLYKDKISYEFEDEKHSSYMIKIGGDENDIVKVTDNNEDGDGWARYSLIGYFEDINSFVFDYSGYEWGGIWVVNTVTGKETYLDEIPSYFKPDNKHFATIMSGNDMGGNGIDIFKINEAGEIISLLPKKYFYEEACYYGCEIVGWRDDKIFVNFIDMISYERGPYSDFIVEIEEDEYLPAYYKLPLFLKESIDENEELALKDEDLLILDFETIKKMIDSDESNNLKDYF